MHNVYAIDKAKNPRPVIFDSPHSGRIYPDDFDYACAFEDLQKCEDHWVDELFANAPAHGGTLLSALFPRSYIDPNRAVDDIDTQLLDRPWGGSIAPSARSHAGIGLIRRLVNPNTALYDRSLLQTEIKQRIDHYYTPYHKALKTLLNETHQNFGCVYHINCHSMPESTAVSQGKPVDFTLGNCDGTSCDPAFTRILRDYIAELGYRVSINDPFKGVELVRAYSQPAQSRHSLQLEINKALYMREKTGGKSKDFEKLKKNIDCIVRFIADYAQAQITPLAAD